MQVKWFFLMKDIIMCDKNSLLKHGNFKFVLFGDGGVASYLKSDF